MTNVREMNSGIYTITNTTNGHRYVGSSVDLRKRWNTHRRYLREEIHGNAHLQSAWKKYGPKAFKFLVLFYCGTKECIALEQIAMDVIKPEYNICPTAGSNLGMKFGPFSDEHRAKIGAAQMGHKVSEETRAKLRAANIGKKHSAESRAKMSASLSGRKYKPLSKEHRAKLSAALTGYKHTAESRAINSASKMGIKKGPPSCETRDKISAGVKANWTTRKAAQESRCSS